jgi:hypothetical protein
MYSPDYVPLRGRLRLPDLAWIVPLIVAACLGKLGKLSHV